MYSFIAAILLALAIAVLAGLLFAHIEPLPEGVKRSALRCALECPFLGSRRQTADGESGIGVVAGILAAAVTQVGALMLDEKNKDYLIPFSRAHWFYEFGNLLLLGMLSGVLRSTKLDDSGISVRSFDMGTRYFVYFSMVWIVIGAMTVVPIVGVYGGFPTQQKTVTLQTEDYKDHIFEDKPYTGQKGLSFKAVIRPLDFNESLPENLVLRIDVTAAFNRVWMLTNVATNEVLTGDGKWDKVPDPPAGSLEPAGPETAMNRSDAYRLGASTVKFLVSNLRPTQAIRVMFRLSPRSLSGVTDKEREASLHTLETGHVITVTAVVPPNPTPNP